MKLLRFEIQRATCVSAGWLGLLGIVISAGVFWGLLVGGARVVGGVSPALAISGLGFLAAASSAMSSAERNRGTVTEDVWWALEPRAGLQTLQIFMAWAVVGAAQGAIIAFIVGVAIGATSASAFIAGYVAGYVAGLPIGVVLTALARRMAGATVITGSASFTALFFAGPIATEFSGPQIEATRTTIALLYVLTCAGVVWALTRGAVRGE